MRATVLSRLASLGMAGMGTLHGDPLDCCKRRARHAVNRMLEFGTETTTSLVAEGPMTDNAAAL